MSNLRENISKRSVDSNKPSTAQQSTSQPFRSKSSDINKGKEIKTVFAPKIPAEHSTMSRHNQAKGGVVPTRTNTNSTVNDVSKQCQNLVINSDGVDVEGGNGPNHPKRKNGKKKERIKQLELPSVNVQMPQPPQAHYNYVGNNEFSSVQDLFMKQINPLYASTSSNYLENLSHHPQFQYLYMQQERALYYNAYQAARAAAAAAASLPNTPMYHVPPRQKSVSNPNTPVLQWVPQNGRFLQNMMQHPLLNQTYTSQNTYTPRENIKYGPREKNNYGPRENINYGPRGNNNYTPKENVNFTPREKINVTPKEKTNVTPQENINDNSSLKNKRNSKKKSDNVEKKFEKYFSAEEVEEGLKSNILLQGILRINPKQFQHSYVANSDRSEQDILIDGIHYRNRALEGDVVIVQFVESDNEDTNSEEIKQKKGKVVFIKERNHTRTCIGVLKLMADKNRQKALFIPRDHRIPRLNIPFTCWPDNFYRDAAAYENTLFLAKIVEWSDTRFAIGQILSNIGQSGDMVAETKAILAQTDLDVTPFGPEVRDLYPRLDYSIPDDEIQLREDCRKLCIFSIDPSNCRDIDDAISCRELTNGNYEIGVHISDVTHFLTENTILDQKVAQKATTIYLVERAYHMLPDELCMLCSLFPGVDKLAFSVFWEITKDAQILNHRFSKTVIHSCSQLAYDHAQAILDGNEDAEATFPETYNGFGYQDISKTIKILGNIAATIRKTRFESGALRIDQPKVAFHLSPGTGLPDSFWIYDLKESNQLIEEFMLLANMYVANKIYDDYPKLAFLRCHPEPSPFMLRQLAKSLKPMGIDLEISSAGDLHRSLLPYVGPENTDRGKAMVLNMLCAKPMTRAKYLCPSGNENEDLKHYALNVPLYTHFTSPIRRYADIMVHRLLAASLNYREVPKWDVDKVRLVAAQCNKQKYNAKKAGELSTELYVLKYIELNSPLLTDAVVVEVREKYIDVIIVSMGLNRRIFFNNDFPGEFNCIKNDGGTKLSKMELTWSAVKQENPPKILPEIKQVIQVFSFLKVHMHRDDEMVKVETKLVRPE